MMKPSSYWQKRFEQLKRDELLATNGSLAETRKLYDRIERSIEKDLAYWYGRYLKNNGGISYQDAQKALSKKELAEFRWTVEEYIEKAKTLELSPEWHKALENASIKAHVTRLESLKLQLKHHSEVLHDTLNKNLGKDLRKVYEGQYYKNLFEIQKGLGQGRLIEALDPSFLDLVIHKPWHKDGLDFSSRIWQARDKLIHTLEQELTYIAIRGDSPDGAIRRISQLFGKSRSHSAMLVQTEHAALASRAQQDAFKALDVEEFEYIATLDGKTSELCQSMDGKHFPMSEYQVGLTAPPLHPRCRSCTAPYFEDMEVPRWARDKDGKGYVIGEEVKFKDWQDEYVVKFLNEESEKPAKKLKIKELSKLKQSKMTEEDYKEYLKIINNHRNPDITKLYAKYADEIEKVSLSVSKHPAYEPIGNTFTFNYNDSIKYNEINKYSTLAHEYGHFFDMKIKYTNLHFKEMEALRGSLEEVSALFQDIASSSDEFLLAVRKDRAHLKSVFTPELKEEFLKNNASFGVQDAIDGLFPNTKLKWGHGERYYNDIYNTIKSLDKTFKKLRLTNKLEEVYNSLGLDASSQSKVKNLCRHYAGASEIWAHVISAEVCGGEALEYVKKYLPNSYKAVLEILKEVE